MAQRTDWKKLGCKEFICPHCNGTGIIRFYEKELCKACNTTNEEIWCKKHLEMQKELLRAMDGEKEVQNDTEDKSK